MGMFKPRKILKSLERFLGGREIIVIHGARQTGKTTLLKIIKDKLIKEKKAAEGDIFYFVLNEFFHFCLCCHWCWLLMIFLFGSMKCEDK